MSEFRVHEPGEKEPTGDECPDCGGSFRPAVVRQNVEWDDNSTGPGYECQECGKVKRI